MTKLVPIYELIIPSPLGEMLLTSEGDGLTGVYFLHQKYYPAQDGRRDGTDLPVLRATATQLDEYFHAGRRAFDLPLTPAGTPFQQQVWMQLRAIPYGVTRSYGELAEAAGGANKSRAVGAANGRNPITIIVPCHRVIGADGSLTGYASGVERKQALLALEGAPIGETARRHHTPSVSANLAFDFGPA